MLGGGRVASIAAIRIRPDLNGNLGTCCYPDTIKLKANNAFIGVDPLCDYSYDCKIEWLFLAFLPGFLSIPG